MMIYQGKLKKIKHSNGYKSKVFFDSAGFQLNRSIFMTLLLLAVGMSILGYIFQTNRLAIMGSEIRNRKNTLEELKQENEQLRIASIKLRSIQNLEEDKESLKMVSPEEVKYIEIDSVMAMK